MLYLCPSSYHVLHRICLAGDAHLVFHISCAIVLALPSVQFYVHGGVVENFPCGPSKIQILKRKLAQFINANVDAKTFTVKPAQEQGSVLAPTRNETVAATATVIKPVPASATPTTEPEVASDTDKLSTKHKAALRAIPYLTNLSDEEFEALVLLPSLSLE